MIEIHFPTPEGGRQRIKITGHSGEDRKGNDVVCAAVSSLLLTMVGGLEIEAQAVICGSLKDGFCDVEIEVPNDRKVNFYSILKVFRYGFKRLSETYPEYVIMN